MVSPLPLLYGLGVVALVAQRLQVGRVIVTTTVPTLNDVVDNITRLDNPTP